MKLIELNDTYRDDVNRHISEEWGLPIVTLGNIIDIRELPGFAAVLNDELAGAILYQIKNNECEIVALFSLAQSMGLGGKMLDAVIQRAREEKCSRVWLITTNDNTPAIRYYQRKGFSLKAVHINSFEEIRKIKPDIPYLGIDDIPILHEVEFEMLLK